MQKRQAVFSEKEDDKPILKWYNAEK